MTKAEGKYKFIREIGHGGTADVWLAEDLRLHKNWAVKVIRKQGMQISPEAAMMTKLDHPMLPRIVDVMEDETFLYIVMDYITGCPLDRLLKRHGVFSAAIVQKWAVELCDVLSYLHGLQPSVIYRDLKPANIMIQPGGHLKLVDLGITAEKQDPVLSAAAVGTNGFAPPEQQEGKRTDERSDIFSLGRTMEVLLTGKIRRRGQRDRKKTRKPAADAKAEGLEMIIRRCTEPDPADRYSSCGELKRDLLHPEYLSSEYRRREKRILVSFFVTASLAVLFAAGGFLFTFRADRMLQLEYNRHLNIAASTPHDEKIRHYEAAARLAAGDPEPFLLLVETWQEEGGFGDQENRDFTDIWNGMQEQFRPEDPEVQRLFLETGRLYFYNFEGEDSTFRSRIRMAEPFFERCAGCAGGTVRDEAENYLELCDFCSRMLFNPDENAMTAENYEELFGKMKRLVIRDTAGQTDMRIRFAAAKVLLQIINSERTDMAVSGFPEERVYEILNEMETFLSEESRNGRYRKDSGELLEMKRLCEQRVRTSYAYQRKKEGQQEARDGEYESMG